MKKNLLLLLSLTALLSQSCGKPSNTQKDPLPSPEKKDSTRIEEKDSNQHLVPHNLSCECSPIKERNAYDVDVRFSQWGEEHDSLKEKALFDAYSHDTSFRKIKCIGFSGYSTIPKRFRIFKNVEYVAFTGVGNWTNKDVKITGLDMFPRLKGIFFWGGAVGIDTTEQWLKQIEYVSLGKSRVFNFPPFHLMPNLKIIEASHSGFEPFPKNINSLHCLQKIMLVEYHGGKEGAVDLTQIDLDNFPCLQKAYFSGGTKGIPQGLDTNRTFELYLRPYGLSKEDKKIVEAYKKRRR